ncbi:hypothetical protein LINPERPRIM_LOCUS5824, partial [Linum perenne]
ASKTTTSAAGHQPPDFESPNGGGRKRTGKETAGEVTSPTATAATGRLKVPQ